MCVEREREEESVQRELESMCREIERGKELLPCFEIESEGVCVEIERGCVQNDRNVFLSREIDSVEIERACVMCV